MNSKKLTDFISRNNQFSTDSDLWKSIKSVLGCTDTQAQVYAKTHCNLLSFFALLYAQDYLTSYSEFFRWCLANNIADNNGYLKEDKPVILQNLNIPAEVIKVPFSANDKYPEGYYQLKITNPHGDHFIACYSTGDYLYLADTNDRGVGVDIVTGLKNTDKKIWLKQII